MINKGKFLGRVPEELGIRDAIHVPIVSVIAGSPIKPGELCEISKSGSTINTAVPHYNGYGVADPFFKGVSISRGQVFWMLIDPNKVSSLSHNWEYPEVDFSAIAVVVKENKYLVEYAQQLGLTYQQLMDSLKYVADNYSPAVYAGTKNFDEVEALVENMEEGDIWYEWMSETGYLFPNIGTECCPKYAFPECSLFEKAE